MDVLYGKQFLKQYDKAGEKIQSAFKARLKLFLENPHHSLLHNHALTGRYMGFRSINITGDWRAIYAVDENGYGIRVTFKLFGTHSQLYRK